MGVFSLPFFFNNFTAAIPLGKEQQEGAVTTRKRNDSH
jgi:hypothetical protein